MIDWQSDAVQRIDEPTNLDLDAIEASHTDVFLERLRKALDELPPPSRALQLRFFLGDCAWRARRFFTTP